MKLLKSILFFSLCCLFAVAQTQNYTEKFFTQQLIDHFNYNNSATFSNRYLEQTHSEWSLENQDPIFVYCGNEADIVAFYENSGFLTQTLFNEYKARVVFIEHRFFGKSLPFGTYNESYLNQNLVYLTVDQALADFVDFLNWYLPSEVKCTDNCPAIITFGGSYGGMLSAWMRMKFPNVIDAAISSSGPILFFPDRVPWETFSEVVTFNYKRSQVPNCMNYIQEGFRRLENYRTKQNFNTTDSQFITSIFELCAPGIHQQDLISSLEDYLMNGFGYMAMTNYPYPSNFLQPMPAWPVNVSCKAFENLTEDLSTISDTILFTTFLDAVKVYYGDQTCFDIFGGISQDNMNGWNILGCNSLPLPFNQVNNSLPLVLTSNFTDNDMFPPRKFNKTEYSMQCQQTYGQQVRYSWTLDNFGGWTLKEFQSYTNILFMNGQLDPWSAGGVTKNISDTVTAFIMNDAAHHLDLRLPNPADPQGVIEGRNIERSWLNKWIQEKKISNQQKKIQQQSQ